MLLAMLLDLLFVGAAVYLFLEGQVVAGVAMMLMGTAATGLVVLRFVSRSRWSRERRTGVPLFRGNGRLRPAEVLLEPDVEESVRVTAQTSKIQAIKQVRDLTGASLRTAKEYVDRLT